MIGVRFGPARHAEHGRNATPRGTRRPVRVRDGGLEEAKSDALNRRSGRIRLDAGLVRNGAGAQ